MKYKYNGDIMDERMEVFLETFLEEMPEYLTDIEFKAQKEHVPVIRRLTGGVLIFFLRAFNVKKVLEIGTATGYSALYMAEGKDDVLIDTIERVPGRIEQAKDNFNKYDRKNRINLIAGDALNILKELSEKEKKYDFIFMDASKGQYKIFAEYVLKLLNPGGVMITDNVMQEGEILESRYAVSRRNRTIHTRMREYLYYITHSKDWNTMILPVGDGIAVSIKNRERWQ